MKLAELLDINPIQKLFLVRIVGIIPNSLRSCERVEIVTCAIDDHLRYIARAYFI